MAQVVVTMKIMPDDPEVDLSAVEKEAREAVSAFEGEVGKVEIEPIAFGLKALNIIFVMEESRGSTDELEDQVRNINGVNSVEITDVRRAIG
jgi:elongation factor 1-beta